MAVKITDLTMLRALLAAHKRLTMGEEKAFKGMLHSLESGLVVNLSKAQRAWAEERFNKLDLGRGGMVPLPPPPPPKAGPVPTFGWEKNKPLKPPGRS